ncbi:hypothetical protein GRZ55_02940 [Chelativorans sp. ZYF759]|uniref:hypothetical protein n=1 Tax=Chelativorans sp. ZYF759 TaxID=2692213 RepID=UPI00145E34D3|nr:hypothetical protein [Chelativorans sp. ZYF759]NMG38195.1 hypothetical protein [Chelativorans sp. ZYF759]
MSAAAILLMIVGCNGGVEECHEIPAPAPYYASIGDCEADGKQAAARHAGQFDEVFRVCAAFDPDLVGEDADIVWDVTAEDGLVVAMEPIHGEDVYVLARTIAPAVQQN